MDTSTTDARAQERENFYITTPIYYVNAVPHLGTAYTTILADVRARFERLNGRNVFFLTGLDEHGEKVANTALENGMTPMEWCDSMVPAFKDLWDALLISNDDFIRTTEERHTRAVQHFWDTLRERGYIYEGEYDGWYCLPDETYFTETQVRHANEEAGDAEGHNCPDCGRPLQRVKENSWFFKLSAFEEPLLAYYEENPEFIQPIIRRNEIESFVRGGLKDLSVSRTGFDWGIPLPFDPKSVTYVWVDALINYITAVGYGDPDKAEEFAMRWPATYHLVGKDIIRFHAAIWPAMLMAADLPLPQHVYVHGFLLTKGEKMSKSRGNAVSPYDFIEIFGVDAYRYYFMCDVTPGADGSISMERMVQVYNADLANSWGNLVSRTLNMVTKYFEGKVPEVPAEFDNASSSLKEVAHDIYPRYAEAMEELDYPSAARIVGELVGVANLYIEESAPWGLAKDPAKAGELAFVLKNILEAIRIAAYLYEPFMPKTSAEVLKRLGTEKPGDETTLQDACAWGLLPAGGQVTVGDPLFPRLDIDAIDLG